MEIFIVIGAISLIVGVLVGYFLSTQIEILKTKKIKEEAEAILKNAKKEAEILKKNLEIEFKSKEFKLKEELERKNRHTLNEIHKMEHLLQKREANLEKRLEAFDRKEKELFEKEKQLRKKDEELTAIIEKEKEELYRITGLTKEEAKEELLKKVEEEIVHETAQMINNRINKAKREADKRAQKIIATAIQRCAVDYTVENTISTVDLPNEDMKGRIIGREGRNIRAFEARTGVDLLVDDNPDVVTLSSHDPVRREIAKIALEKLIVDGRIQPARIEEVVTKAEKEVKDIIREEGERAVFELGLKRIHPKLIDLLGRLKYRTSYGQNVLIHSKEVAYFGRIMAEELGLNVELTKRAGLLHDIGKALGQEKEGAHALIGAEFAKSCGESKEVVNAIAAHHGEEEPMTIEAILVQVADAISAARPGARRESIENYIRRLQNLEKIAMSHEGVERAYAIQAGREVRVIVNPENIDDDTALTMARQISKEIEENIQFPGQIKVLVIREKRFIEYVR